VALDNLKIVPDAASLYRAAADEFVSAARKAVAKKGRFGVALSGGNTPRGVYSLLAAEGDSLPWSRIFVFFGDERCVPPDHPDSNYRMANESLLSRVPIPQENIFRVQAELPAEVAAQRYEDALRQFFRPAAGEFPQFDLVFLGMGEDGHTASLFPGSAALDERSRFVVANWVEKFKSYRITLTFPVLNNAAEVCFVVAGSGKAAVIHDIFAAGQREKYPAGRVRPVSGKLLWMVDREAAEMLSRE
jgi:6-phosphogluconolactonase